MFKMAMVAVLTVALTGCVRYTNSKGEECTTSLDPTAWVFTGLAATNGIDMSDAVHSCKPAE